jgi:DNA-binding transcriptional LysR family regulator
MARALDGDGAALLDVRLRQLAYLRETARAGGVTLAAEQLGVSQPALSRALAELERRVGVPLFERDGRRRRLTGEGEEVLAFAERVGAQAEALRERLSERARGERGPLRVGMIDAASLYVLPDVVRRFRERFPDVDLTLTVDTSSALLERLRRFELDLAFVVGPADEELWSVEVEREPLHLYSPPGSRGDPADSDWVLYPRGQRTRGLIDAGLARLGIEPCVTLESHNPEVLRQMVVLGLGWSVLPPAIAERGSAALRRRRGPQVAERVLVGVRRATAPPHPRREAFLALALEARRAATGEGAGRASSANPAGPRPAGVT